jgi:hypothetical protein
VSVRDNEYHDTVYVTANPKLSHSSIPNSVFHDTIFTWRECKITDEEHRSLEPELVTELLLRSSEIYPEKRIIGHYMQPHCPFLGSEGREALPETPWKQHMLKKKVSTDIIQRLYIENLNYVLPHLQTVFEQLDGRVVITADHGQLLGERVFPIPIREYAHPAGIYVPELVEIPYQIREGTDRRRVTSEPPVIHESASESSNHDVNELLGQLGYRS